MHCVDMDRRVGCLLMVGLGEVLVVTAGVLTDLSRLEGSVMSEKNVTRIINLHAESIIHSIISKQD